MYRDLRYILDQGHPLQPLAVKRSRFVLASLYIVPSSRPWECGNPGGISKECGKGGKPALWLSMLSTLRHFHGLHLSAGRS